MPEGLLAVRKVHPARTLSWHLAVMTAGLLIPVLLLAGTIAALHIRAERARLHADALDAARAIAVAVDRELAGMIGMAEVLGLSRSLRRGALDSFAERAEEMHRVLGLNVMVRDMTGQQVVNSHLPPGSPLPRHTPRYTPPFDGRARITDLLEGTTAQRTIFAAYIGVPDQVGTERYVLYLTASPERLQRVLEQIVLPEGWAVAVLDARHRIVVRSPDPEHFAGRQSASMGPPGWRDRADAVWRARNLDGTEVMVATVSSRLSDWRVSVLVPEQLAAAPLRRSLQALGVLALVLATLALALGALVARRIAGAVKALARAAEGIPRGEAPVAPETPVREVNEVGAVMAGAATELLGRTAALAESEARLARAVVAGRIATWEWSAATGRLTGSPGREWLYGHKAGEVATWDDVMNATVPEDRARIAAAVRDALRRNGTGIFDVDFRVTAQDGSARWLRSQATVLERDADGRAVRVAGVTLNVTEQRQIEERERLLARELDHRAKNVMAVVQSLLMLSPRARPTADFVRDFSGRIAAMARAHDLLSAGGWGEVELRALLEGELAPYAGVGLAMQLEGPRVMLRGHCVQSLAMVLHELATNAGKHGALSRPEGRLAVRWTAAPEGGVMLSWTERGGPPLAGAEPSPNFGMRLISRTMAAIAGSGSSFRWEAEGLECHFHLGTWCIASVAMAETLAAAES